MDKARIDCVMYGNPRDKENPCTGLNELLCRDSVCPFYTSKKTHWRDMDNFIHPIANAQEKPTKII